MDHHRNTTADIRASWTARALPRPIDYRQATLSEYHQAMDNFHRVFAIRPGERVLMLTDPLIDPRIEQALRGIAQARGAAFGSYMAQSGQINIVPDEVKPLLERADFVVFTWFASIDDPFVHALRRNGQRHVKLTYFRNFDDLQTPQARFPLDVLGEIVRANRRFYPEEGAFDMRFTDPRGSELTVNFTEDMVRTLARDNRWRGHHVADEDGCYVHYLPTHGPNLYDILSLGKGLTSPAGPVNGVLYPQWGVGFEQPFEDKIGIVFENDHVVKVEGNSEPAGVLREMLIGGRLLELGCGHNPKARRFDVYPAGPNSPGGLHFGINFPNRSDYIRRVLPHWEEPPIHMDLVTFDTTVKAADRTFLDDGFLMALRDPAVVALAERYGDPLDLLENFVQ